MKQKKTKHQFRSNTLPALVTVGPVTVLVVLLIAVPLIYVAVMLSFLYQTRMIPVEGKNTPIVYFH